MRGYDANWQARSFIMLGPGQGASVASESRVQSMRRVYAS